MDSFEGNQSDPSSLHKYLYCAADPVNNVDPSGHATEGLSGQAVTGNIIGQMATRGGLAIGRSVGWAAQRLNYAALRGLQFYVANEAYIALGTFVIPPAIVAGDFTQWAIPFGTFLSPSRAQLSW